MRSDLSNLDRAMTETDIIESIPAASLTNGRRTAKRVPVHLQVAIGTNDTAYLADCVDISETGLLMENYAGPKLCEGKMVHVLVQGIVCDSDEDQFLNMMVARCTGNLVALAF